MYKATINILLTLHKQYEQYVAKLYIVTDTKEEYIQWMISSQTITSSIVQQLRGVLLQIVRIDRFVHFRNLWANNWRKKIGTHFLDHF